MVYNYVNFTNIFYDKERSRCVDLIGSVESLIRFPTWLYNILQGFYPGVS
jgi:hypothetical protein